MSMLLMLQTVDFYMLLLLQQLMSISLWMVMLLWWLLLLLLLRLLVLFSVVTEVYSVARAEVICRSRRSEMAARQFDDMRSDANAPMTAEDAS